MGNIYHIGIDLGTSHTSIATSTGKRLTYTTCVGYPKDPIAQKRLGKACLIGEEALANRLSLDMVWPLAEGVISSDKRAIEATQTILTHMIDETLGERKKGDNIFAAIGVPAQASIKNKKAILEASKGIVDKLIVVSEPFAVAFSIDRLDGCMIVDIGAGTSDICRMRGALPDADDQLTLPYAGNFLDEVLSKAILEKYPDVQLSAKIIREIKEKHGYVADHSDPVEVTLNSRGKPGTYDLSDVLHQSCLKLAEPICAAIQEMVGTFDPDFQERLRNNIILAGGGSRLKGLDLAIIRSLDAYGGGNAVCVKDAEFCGCMGALKMSVEMPEQYWEKI